jgi:hypothetical protein
MPPNQVFYLKGSSMDSFTLGLLPKINFNINKDNHTSNTRELVNLHNISQILSLSYREFNTEFCEEYMPIGLYL